ncbi:hypothetical protein C6P45_004397 [Maudiozyma exigua]|uniref:Uncharacterized protein n=1 Tax=Maudiozyma exigua TaxID=34358 RepID=A0A9P7BBS5_MAUEX|nr:hypothetical protein C6P45_004397 [Kazachstania exigua]
MILGSLVLMNNSSLNENISLSIKNISKAKPTMSYPNEITNTNKFRNRSVSSPITPSMSSVISQIKQLSGETSSLPQNKIKRQNGQPLRRCSGSVIDEHIYIPKRKHRAQPSSEPGTAHPLQNNESKCTIRQGSEPLVKLFKMEDLDLTDSLTEDDIMKQIPPVYLRHKKKRSFVRNNTQQKKIIQENTKDLELEVWPDSGKTNNDDGIVDASVLLPDNKRVRQRSMNPNFLKLLAIERYSIDNNILPEVHIDNQTFNSLSVHPDTQVVDSLDFNDDVRLAIKTKLKLWNDLGRGTLRNDPYGDSVPWNMDFIQANNQTSSKSKLQDSSLVRMNSTLKPWCNDTNELKEKHAMLKPCGKFSNGSQYVVKGWCDSRFFQ